MLDFRGDVHLYIGCGLVSFKGGPTTGAEVASQLLSQKRPVDRVFFLDEIHLGNPKLNHFFNGWTW